MWMIFILIIVLVVIWMRRRRSFRSTYSPHLRQMPQKYLKHVQMHDVIVNQLVREYPSLRFTPKYEMSVDNLEQNRPFTLDGTIIIPQQRLSRLHSIDDDFLQTLIHERVHIVQRYNQRKFDDFYRRVYRLKKIGTMKNVNPDANTDDWRLEDNLVADHLSDNLVADHLSDHPNELFAYAVAPAITRGESNRETYFLRNYQLNYTQV